MFQGVWPALVTPFGADGKPALDVVERLTALFAEQGLDGLYIVGSTGQWPLLTRAERKSVAECVVSTARATSRNGGGKLATIVHVGAASTEEAGELSQHARGLGADGISAVGPIYFGYSADAIFEHYRQIGLAGELPLFVYHLGGVSKSIPPADYVQRLLTVPNIAGMKFTDCDLYTLGLLQVYSEGKLKLFSGADEVFCHAVLTGAVGAIGTFYNLWGPACRRVWQAVRAGDVSQGQAFMLRFQQAIAEVLGSGSVWSFLRSAMRLKYDIDIGMPRPPLGVVDKPWQDKDVQRLIELVDGA